MCTIVHTERFLDHREVDIRLMNGTEKKLYRKFKKPYLWCEYLCDDNQDLSVLTQE